MAVSAEDESLRGSGSPDVHPVVPFEIGKELGSKGAPIPPKLADDFIAFLDLHSRFAELSSAEQKEYFSASAQAYSRSEDRGIPQTAMQTALDAEAMIAGYKLGLDNFMCGAGADGVRRVSIEDMARLSSDLIADSASRVRAYMTGYKLLKPAHLEDGGELGRDGLVVDAHALGFVVKAATLGIRVRRSEVPVSVNEWVAFEHGMARDRQGFSQLIARINTQDHAAAASAIYGYVLGKQLNAAIQRASSAVSSV
jgi:hypothetical protein